MWTKKIKIKADMDSFAEQKTFHVCLYRTDKMAEYDVPAENEQEAEAYAIKHQKDLDFHEADRPFIAVIPEEQAAVK